MKSSQLPPTSGRTSAVQNPQNTAHSKTQFMGRSKTVSATSTSLTPTISRIVRAVGSLTFVSWEIQPIQSFLPCTAKRPCPKNSPATPIRSAHSIFRSEEHTSELQSHFHL